MLQFTANLHQQFLNLYGAGGQSENIAGAALGGQDVVLADYLLSARARFALIEFKDNEASIATEKDKKLRLLLCKKLNADRGSAALSRDVHYVAWGVRQEKDLGTSIGWQFVEDTVVASYPSKVCPLLGCNVDVSPRHAYASEEFIQRFLASRVAGTHAARFKKYLELLYRLADGVASNELKRFEGSVYVFVPTPDGVLPAKFLKVRFVGLDHLFMLTLGKQRTHDREEVQEQERNGPTRERGLGRG